MVRALAGDSTITSGLPIGREANGARGAGVKQLIDLPVADMAGRAASANRQDDEMDNDPSPPSITDLGRLAASAASRSETDRRLDPAVIDSIRSSRIVALLAPSSRGGRQGSVEDLVRSGLALGRHDTSTAWVTSFYVLHTWLAALFPPDGQDDLFGDTSEIYAPAVFSPTGTAIAGADGYRVTGRWQWGTGVCHADWAMVACLVRHSADAAPHDARLLAVPIADVTVHDTWNSSGMRATGSHDIAVEDIAVPAHRSISFAALLDGSAAAESGNDAPLYRWPLAAILSLGAAAPAVGTARGVLDRYEERVGSRRLAYTGVLDADRPSTWARVATAHVELEATEHQLTHTAAAISATLESGAGIGLEQRGHARMVASRAVAVARKVAADVSSASGASAQMNDDPLPRALRDLATLSGHVVFDHDSTSELYGALRLGRTPPAGLL